MTVDDTDTDTDTAVRLLLGIARLGEKDLRGWWRGHGLDRTGRYVLSGMLRRTWRPAGLQMDIVAAGRYHDDVLGRASALHLFSDHLPFRRWALGWLSEQKTAPESELLRRLEAWDEAGALAELRDWTSGVDPSAGELLGEGLLMGSMTATEIGDAATLRRVATLLAAAYLPQGSKLRPPYLDLMS